MPGRNKGVRKVYHCAHAHSPVSLTPAFIEKTIRVFQPYSETPLTEEDAREITANMVTLFLYLAELDRKYHPNQREPLSAKQM